MKRCFRCLVEQTKDQFRKSSRTKDGLYSWCNSCARSYQRERRLRAPILQRKARIRDEEPLTDAQRALAEEHVPYAKRGARRYARLAFDTGSWTVLDYDEFVSAAFEGLVHAARKFDPQRGVSFKTYAFGWIDRYLKLVILRARRGNGWMWHPVKSDGEKGKNEW